MVIDLELNSNFDIYRDNKKEIKPLKIVNNRIKLEIEKIKRYLTFKKGGLVYNLDKGYTLGNLNYLDNPQDYLDKMALTLIRELNLVALLSIEFIKFTNDNKISFFIYMQDINFDLNNHNDNKYYMEIG